MHVALSDLRRVAAAFLVVTSFFTATDLGGSALAESLPVVSGGTAALQPIHQPVTLGDGKEPLLLAHHEGSSAGVGQLLHDDQDPEAEVTDSLWGNLILSMAYRRDPELKQWIKKMGVSNNLFLASIAGVSGLGLAQSITGLATLNQSESGGGHHEEHEHGGGGGHREHLAPSIMGVAGSAATLVSIGAHVYFEQRYKKKIKARQQVLNHEVLHILEALESGANQELVQPKLVNLIGQRATGEFMQLWRSAHP